jgi:hypothetical protein
MKDGNRNARSGGVGRTRATGDKSAKAVNTAQNDAKKARSERDAIFKAAQENEAVRSKEIQDLQAMLASITEQGVREQVEAQLDNMARQSREATVEILGMRDEEGDIGMIDPDDQAEGSGEQEEPDDTTGVGEAAKNGAIEKQLKEQLAHLPLPVNQRFYSDKNDNLQVVDSIGADDVCPVAKQEVVIDDNGTKEITKYIVTYGQGSDRIYRFYRANEIHFDKSITDNLPTFPTAKFNTRRPQLHKNGVRKADLKYISNVAFHGSPDILADEGLRPRQVKNGLRYNDTYPILAMPDGTFKFPRGSTFTELHGKGAAPGYDVDLDEDPNHGAHFKILNCAREAQIRYRTVVMRKQLTEDFEKSKDIKSEESEEDNQEANQNPSGKAASSTSTAGLNNSSVGQDTTANQGQKRSREDTPAPPSDPTNQSTAQSSEGSSQGEAVQTGGRTERPPAKVVKPSAESSATTARNLAEADVPIKSIEIPDSPKADDNKSAKQLPTPSSSQSPEPTAK